MNTFIKYIETNNTIIGLINNMELLKYDILIPNEQRIKDNDKINDIIDYQEAYNRKNGKFNFLGVINIHCCNGDYYLVDGQHRFNAIKKLSAKGYEQINVIVELVHVDSIDLLKDNYKLINKNTPLPEFPETIDKNIPESVAQYFFDKYPTIWSKTNTTRVRRPHLNKNNFQESLGVLTDKLNIKNQSTLLKIVEDYNTKLSQWSFDRFPGYKSYKDPIKIEQKCKSSKIYLGLYTHKSNDYGYDWVKSIIKEQSGVDIKSPKKNKFKVKIPQSIRKQVWYKYIGLDVGSAKCICCNFNTISQLNFEAGHIVPQSKGGPNIINNLLPICSDCNRSMSNTHMEEYITKYHHNNLDLFQSKKYNLSII